MSTLYRTGALARRLLAGTAALAAAIAAAGLAAPASAAGGGTGAGFVTRHGSGLTLHGKPFRFAGANNYYLMYKSRLMVDDVFADAGAAGFTVLRTWGWLDIGNQDGSNSVAGPADGVYFQYWDGTRPAYNDGPDGLQRLDYVLLRARQAGIKLVIPFTNNWRDFGGMDQYVRWRGGQFHDDFYTDATIRGWYKDWISHVLNRTNTLTGIRYKDDPTVMTWELGNEPRCVGSGVYPRSATCTTRTLLTWADEMTRHIKSIDRRHLVSVGDEGFFCDDPASTDWTLNCGEGVDTVGFTRLPAVDVMSFHLYPEPWGKDAAWGTDWARRHVREARRLGKPVMFGEFGLPDKDLRNPVYQQWMDAFIGAGGTGFLYWILSGIQDDGTLYPDFDGLTVYCPTPVCQTVSNAGRLITGPRRSFPPVADHDNVVTEFDTAVTARPADNDIAYRSTVRPGSIDLDPAAAGQQTSHTVPGGQFTLGPDGALAFTPTAGFSGKATVAYTVRDGFGRTSNVANVVVTVKPDPGAAITLASWETGTDGWAPGNWQANAGTLTPTADFHTHGAAGLHVDAVEGGWFGAAFAEPLDLSTKSLVRFDLRTGAAGTSRSLVFQVGPEFTWCQSTFVWVPQEQTTTVEVDLLTEMSCDPATFRDIRGIFLWISPGQFDLDHIRAE